MFRVNEVLKYDERLFRVLSVLGPQLVWFDMEDPKAFPSLVRVDDLMKAFDDVALSRMEDPYAGLAMETPAPGSTAQIKRDKNYALVLKVADHPEYYDRKH